MWQVYVNQGLIRVLNWGLLLNYRRYKTVRNFMYKFNILNINHL